MFCNAVWVMRSKARRFGNGRIETVPNDWRELYWTRSPGESRLVEPMPLTFATQIALCDPSYAIAPGNQPTGIRPRIFERPGSKSKTATAFWDPLQTNRVRPVES